MSGAGNSSSKQTPDRSVGDYPISSGILTQLFVDVRKKAFLKLNDHHPPPIENPAAIRIL